MSELSLETRPSGLGARADRGVARWLTSPDRLVVRRSVVAVGLIAIAYHYSLSTLLRTLKSETPLAYLGLVPLIAMLLAAARIHADPTEPPIHDRQIDYIVGLPLLLGALAFDVVMPIRMSTLFWLDRLDLVSLPFFVAGVVAVVFGVRALWRLRASVLFLVLAWPLPYSTLLVNWLSAFTASTLTGLNVLLSIARVATAAPTQGAGTYVVRHGAGSFPVSVASACSGVNGIVGYALVAVAFVTVVSGSAVRKAAWLTAGLAAVWTSNVIRIFVILLVGHYWGGTFAIDVLHPVVGLLMFNLVVMGMVVAMRRFGLALNYSARWSTVKLTAQLARAVPNATRAVGVVAIIAIIGYVANSSLRQYDLVLSDLGSPRLVSFSDAPAHPEGWEVARTNTYTWAKPFFGNDSTWYRYAFTWSGFGATLKSNEAVVSDVINTSDVTTFSTYGIEACYQFHGYKLYSVRTVDLGGGVTGNVLAYYNTSTKSDWTTVYWHWPVKAPNGKTRYERVTLMLVNTERATFATPPASPSLIRSLGLTVQNALHGRSTATNRFDQTRTFLVEFARQLIAAQAAASPAQPTSVRS